MHRRDIEFPPFRLEWSNARLLRDGVPVPLRPKPFAALSLLLERHGELVSKDELNRAVWPEVAVSDVSLKVCIREVRKALGDEPRRPRFIETVHRRGYRFIGQVAGERAEAGASGGSAVVVGRERELEQLGAQHLEALQGARQVTLVSGPAGIGKSTLVETFRGGLDESACWVVQGRCAEQYGAGEPFLPLLEGLTRLGHRTEGERLVEMLREYAPSWLVQLPGLIPPAEREALRSRYVGAAWQRMQRELVVGLEALSAEAPIVLLVEDLHWADHSSLDLLRALGAAREPARLHLICTFRAGDSQAPAGALAALRQELGSRTHATELALERLGEAAVREYLERRLADEQLAAALSPRLTTLTGGHPLFVATVVDGLLRRLPIDGDQSRSPEERVSRLVAEAPKSLHQLIRRQLEHLEPAELSLVQAASAIGEEFEAGDVAAALGESPERIAGLCERMARRGELLRFTTGLRLPGFGADRFEFVHPVFGDVLRATLTAEQQKVLHAGLMRRLESSEVSESGLVLPVRLASHAEQASDLPRTVKYLIEAGRSASERFADREAIDNLSRGLELLAGLPEGLERDRLELELQVALAVPLLNTLGFVHPQVERVHSRALELCERVGDAPHFFRSVEGLHTYYSLRGDLPTALRLAERLMAMARRERDPLMLVEGHHTLGCTEVRRADLSTSRSHLEEAIATYDRRRSGAAIELSGHDPCVCCLSHLGLALWIGGLPDQGLERARQALEYARELAHPSSIGISRELLAWLHVLRGEPQAALEQANAVVQLGQENGFPYHAAIGFMLQGRARAALGDAEAGLALLRQGQAMREVLGIGSGGVDYLLLLAESCALAGRVDEALAALDRCQPLIDDQEERLFEPEILRLRGELLLQREVADHGREERELEARVLLEQAWRAAGDCGARSLELRAATSLVRVVWAEGEVRGEDEKRLREACAAFSEGYETSDLRSAALLIGERN